MDTTRTLGAVQASRTTKHARRQDTAQARVADLAFSKFMREHNAKIERLANKENPA